MAALPIATWARIEAHARTTDLDTGLAAEVADPLWMLLRQYQLGELTGDDGGAPVAVDVQVSWSRLTRYRPQGRRGTIGDPLPAADSELIVGEDLPPLEATVTGEPAFRLPSAGRDPRDRPWAAALRAGRALARALAGQGLGAVATTLAADPRTRFDPPPATGAEGDTERRHRALLAAATPGVRPSIDGAAVLSLLEPDGRLPADLLAPADPEVVAPVLLSWQAEMGREWGISSNADPLPPAWVADRLEYAFALAAPALPPVTDAPPGQEIPPGEIQLGASEYDGRGLEWYSLDLAGGPPLGAAADTALDTPLDAPPDGLPPAASDDARRIRGRRRATALPAALTYPGMPSARFWEMEDAAVALGRVGAGATDLVRMLAVDFAVVYSPDWFLAPVEVPVGSVSRVDWVVVRDTFGVATLVGTGQPGPGTVGRQFQPSAPADAGGDAEPLLVVLPAALGALASPPREDIALQRDEMANLAWAIERTVLGPTGRGVPRPWSKRDFAPPAAPPDGHDAVWRLSTPVAAAWTPLVPVRLPDPADPGQQPPSGPRVLRAGQLEDTATATVRGAASLILADLRDPAGGGRHADLREEEVTRAGIQVQIIEHLARGTDGRLFSWRGRQKRPWRGEVSSGLRYDATTER
ncbi:hypothetical protein [Frankia sp. CiP3]|uniref:hypothetical protein n=1 Tax=Frankia sp. CiP3 TaxID=2880971 RepID=UPI001EF43EBF|nr:hypothetical protein [Frankia sp. CiP3]